MSVLQCVAVCCSVLQAVAICCNVFVNRETLSYSCNVLQRVAACCSVFRCVAECCGVFAGAEARGFVLQLQCVAACCSVLQRVAVRLPAQRPEALKCSFSLGFDCSSLCSWGVLKHVAACCS